MPKLIIDNIPVEVAPGTSVLEAARSVGITIPHFCYHPALAIAAACRLCAVKLLDGPVKGIQMSCSLPAQDDMVVSTTDPEAVQMRSLVIEWLMINHPHDCPVCDEGGECLLQDFTIAGGHGRRRYQGKKRTFTNQYLGEGIYHEMNRCIQCYRCVRFYQDYAGGTDFGVTGSAGRVYFGRKEDGPLESPFSGNLVDICPTGVFTDKTGRFRARYWDYDFAPSICQDCSLGCNTSPQVYQRELIKIVGRRNDQVNGWFICDRGRFGKAEVMGPERPRQPLIEGAAVAYQEALEALAGRMTRFVNENGTGSLALVGSPRLSLEGCLLLGQLADKLGATACYFTDPALAKASQGAVQLLNEQNSASLVDLEQADCIALLSLDLMEEAPMMALSIRKAWRKGTPVYLVAPGIDAARQAQLPFQVTVLADWREVPLEGKTKAVFVCGAGVDPALPTLLAATGARLALLQPGPNGFGAALVARNQGGASFTEAVAGGKVKGAVFFEAEFPAGLAQKVEVLGCIDWKPTTAAASAGVFLPTTPWVESDGTSINFEGRAQRFEKAARPGLPLRGLDAKFHAPNRDGVVPVPAPPHPPRVHRAEPPGGAPLDAWKVMAQLLELLGGEAPVQPLTGKWANLAALDPEGGGRRIFDL